MYKIVISCISILTLSFGLANAQEKYTISGTIKDSSNGETLIGAAMLVKEISNGTVSNVYGFYSITLPAATYSLEFSYIGYKSIARQITLNKNERIDIELIPESVELEGIVIEAEEESSTDIRSIEMSTNKLDATAIAKIPAFLGEVDIIKSIQLLPGVSTVGEGASGFNVRGGSVGQNLILLDEAPVYNSSHLLGFFSVFNPDAVKDIKLYKGAVPSRYGGRLASLLDVRMKEGNNKKFEVGGGIGTVFSRIAVEGPLIKEKASFIVAARRSYVDVLARPFVELLKDGGALNFYDINLKTNYTISSKDRVYLSGYFGRDNFKFDANQGFEWGNSTATFRWNHLFSDRIFSNITALFSNYDYQLAFGEDNLNSFKWASNIKNYLVRPELTYFIDGNNELSFGGEAIYYTFEPANAVGVSNGESIDISLDRKYTLENSLYVGNRQKVTSALTLEYGLRFSHFQYFGPGTIYSYNDTIPGIRKSVASEQTFAQGETIQTYDNWEPRFSFNYVLGNKSSIKGSYNRMAQYLHLISNTTASNPLDVWTPSSNNTKPELGDQFTLGYFRNFKNKEWEASIEAYYRSTQNQIDYIDGADLLINQFLEGDLLSGEGRAYGLEFFLRREKGRFNGWVSYTLGRSELQVDGINKGEWYPTRFDQTHNIKLAGFYDINKRWSVSADFVFITGTPTTFPTSRYQIQGMLIPHNIYESRNNVRIPSYNRLDISVRWDGKKVKRDGSVRKNTDYWVFSVYNAYARKNPFSIYFAQSDNRVVPGEPISSQATQLSIVGTVVPSISYNFKF